MPCFILPELHFKGEFSQTKIFVEVRGNDFESAVRTFRKVGKNLVRQARARSEHVGKAKKKRIKHQKAVRRTRWTEDDATFLAHSLSFCTPKEQKTKPRGGLSLRNTSFGGRPTLIRHGRGVLVINIKLKKGRPKIIVIRDREKRDRNDIPLYGFVYGGVEHDGQGNEKETAPEAGDRETHEEAFFGQKVSVDIKDDHLIDIFYKTRGYSFNAYYAFVNEDARIAPGEEQLSVHEMDPEEIDAKIISNEFVGPHASVWRVFCQQFSHILHPKKSPSAA